MITLTNEKKIRKKKKSKKKGIIPLFVKNSCFLLGPRVGYVLCLGYCCCFLGLQAIQCLRLWALESLVLRTPFFIGNGSLYKFLCARFSKRSKQHVALLPLLSSVFCVFFVFFYIFLFIFLFLFGYRSTSVRLYIGKFRVFHCFRCKYIYLR